eukprot:CAMPEP_0184967160 /NCGR_PEP_ID=MMETSP1098-20130426/636_1 /TAXON_ID=89044 /ORGANISM="Spumella elongata, Strain CCAP 955/1" /LENGTH=1639 /DNA_ID=CAMNT_0027488573 /DNA_START=77 /DNA_END=4996 /DNA_ORIENTATION=+
MSSQELEQKQKQLDDLQKSFNEYVESSKELEAELDQALEEAAEKLDKSAEREAAAEQKAAELQKKVEDLTKTLNSRPTPTMNGSNEEFYYKIRSLENENEELSNQVRILESSVEDYEHRIQGLEEDAVFLKTDLEESEVARTDLEAELKGEIEALEKKLAISDADRRKLSNDVAEMTKKVVNDPNSHNGHDQPADDRVQMLLFKQDKDIDFIKSTLDALAVENNEAHKHAHHEAHSPVWHERVEDLRRQLRDVEHEKRELNEELLALRKELADAKDKNPQSEEVEELYQLNIEYKRELEEHRTLTFQYEHQVETLREETTRLRADLEDKQDVTMQADGDVALLKHQLMDLTQALEELERVHSEVLTENDQLRESLTELQQNNTDLQESYSTLQIDHTDLQQVVNDLQTANSDLRLQNEDLVQAQGELAADKEELLAARDSLEQELLEAKEKEASQPPASSTQSIVEINSSSTTTVNITQVINSGDKEKMKAALLRLASQYDALRHSNTKMLNKLQALQGNIQVCCRTRPPSYQELANGGKICIDAADDTELMCYDGRSEVWKSFVFDRVWKADANQAEVFADVEPMVVSVLDGYNACILAYGQTGSGKTFTMDGYGDQFGMSYRTIQKLFDLLILRKVQAEAHAARVDQLSKEGSARDRDFKSNINRRKSSLPAGATATASSKTNANSSTSDETDDTASVTSSEEHVPFSFTLTVSMMEIYNEQVYDLLGSGGINGQGGQAGGASLDIRQGADNNVSVPGLVSMPVNSLQDVMNVFGRGAANRATASTNLNEHSSRSHLIVQVDVTTTKGSDMPVRGRLNLVDLAGSERVGKSGVTGLAMKEAQHINKSLSALGDVMEALDQKSKHVPYRNSKLTYLLQHSLGGNSRTMMIVTVCPTDLTFEESLFTLQFATRVRNITVGPATKHSNAKNLEEQIKAMKAEMKEMKRTKLAAEEALHDMRKELKKVPPSALMEAKLKTIEEARKAGEILMQQLNRQITEANMKLSEEKEAKEALNNDLSMAQKNLKKALDQVKELTRTNDRLGSLIKKKDSELESLHEQQSLDGLSVNPGDSSNSVTSNKPPPAPPAGPQRGINSSARRVLPHGASSNLLTTAPARKRSTANLKEFMLPTASHVAHVQASQADHQTYAENITQATHGNLNPTVSATATAAGSPPLARRGSFMSDTGSVISVETFNPNTSLGRTSSLAELLTPTAAHLNRIQAKEAEKAVKAEEAKRQTHAGFTRLSVSPGPTRPTKYDSDDNVSVNTGTKSSTEPFVNPRGHSSWQDALAPTAARRASLAASEEDAARRAAEKEKATHAAGAGFFHVTSPTNKGEDKSPTAVPRASGDWVNPKGHTTWEDAMAPTKSRRASLTAAEMEAARRAEENAQATHAIGRGRFSVSPGRSQWDTGDDGSVVSGRGSVNPDFNLPKNRSWYDATGPTVARQAAIAATEAEHYASLEANSPAGSSRPWVPPSKDPVRPPAVPIPVPEVTLDAPPRARPSTNGPARDSSVSRRASTASATPPAPAPTSAGAKRAPATSLASPSGSSRLSVNSNEHHSSSKESKESVSLLASSSMVRRSAVPSSAESVSSSAQNNTSSSGYSSRMPTLSVRSEEAMKRHQMRMDKRREVSASSGAVIR